MNGNEFTSKFLLCTAQCAVGGTTDLSPGGFGSFIFQYGFNETDGPTTFTNVENKGKNI